jgi:hypothetical protein
MKTTKKNTGWTTEKIKKLHCLLNNQMEMFGYSTTLRKMMDSLEREYIIKTETMING